MVSRVTMCTSLYLDSNIVWLGTEKGLNSIEILPRVTEKPAFNIRWRCLQDNINTIAAKENKVFVAHPKD